MKSPERDAQKSVVAWLRQVLPAGSLVAAVKNEHRASSGTQGGRIRFYAARKAEGVVTGWPDLIICVPGRTLFVEMKAPGSGVLSAEQVALHDQLRALGFAVGVATCIETTRAFLLSAGVTLAEVAGQATKEARVRVASKTRRGVDPRIAKIAALRSKVPF